MEYINRGGTYIVQYQRGNFETGGFAPYRTGKEAPAQPDRRLDPEPAPFYLNEADIASASPRSRAAKPKGRIHRRPWRTSFESMQSAGLERVLLNAATWPRIFLNCDVIVVGPDAASRPGVCGIQLSPARLRAKKALILHTRRLSLSAASFRVSEAGPRGPLRVTDETAKVTILRPNHPRFRFSKQDHRAPTSKAGTGAGGLTF